jgi:Ca2+ transporting ATPase
LQALFAITPLNWAEWKAVLYLSAPVIVIDEVLKFISVRSISVLVLRVLTCFQATFVNPPSKVKLD